MIQKSSLMILIVYIHVFTSCASFQPVALSTVSSTPSVRTLEATITLPPTVTATFTERPTSTPLPACEAEVAIRETARFHFKAVSPHDCVFFLKYGKQIDNEMVRLGLGDMFVDFYVFGTIYDVAEFERQASLQWGLRVPALDEAVYGWQIGGGYGFPGFAMFTTDPRSWYARQRNEGDRLANLAHEWRHLVQYYLAVGGENINAETPSNIPAKQKAQRMFNGSIPAWVKEGDAEYFATKFAKSVDKSPTSVRPALDQCTGKSLDQVNKDGNCLYAGGWQAFVLLEHLCGDHTLDLWEEIGKGNNFSQAFYAVYSNRCQIVVLDGNSVDEMTLSIFKQIYGLYSDAGFRFKGVPIVTPTQTITPTPD